MTSESATPGIRDVTWQEIDANLQAINFAEQQERASKQEQTLHSDMRSAQVQAQLAEEAKQREIAARKAAEEKAARERRAAQERAAKEREAKERDKAKEKQPAKDEAPATDKSRAAMQAYAKSLMLTKFGWGDDQYGCLVKLWDKESRWKWNAKNPASSAYGIPQALPGKRMAKAGADWQTNPKTQVKWGLDYIEGRYGVPCKAWQHSIDNNWY